MNSAATPVAAFVSLDTTSNVRFPEADVQNVRVEVKLMAALGRKQSSVNG